MGDTVLPVTVNPPPIALFSANTDNCQGQSVAFANQSVSTSGFINYLGMGFWRWKYPNRHFPGYAQCNPYLCRNRHVSAVTLTVTNNEGCSHSETRTVNSLGAPYV